MRKLLAICMLVIPMVTLSQGITNGTSLYYVGSGGSNSNDGKSWANRWADLSKVNSTLGSEANYDTVLVADGVYTDELNLDYSGASSSAILVVMNYGTNRPEIRRYSGYGQYGWAGTSADSNQMLQGFLIQADRYIYWTGVKRLILQDCYAVNRREDEGYEQGYILDYSSWCTVRRCTTLTEDYDDEWGDGNPTGDDTTAYEHNGLSCFHASYILVEDCWFRGTVRHYTQASGYASTDNHHIIWRNNVVERNHGMSEASAGGAHHLLFENITYRRQFSSWTSQNGKGGHWQTLGGHDIIYRLNTIIKDTNGYNPQRATFGFGIAGTGSEDQTYNLAIYHNTVMGAPHVAQWWPPPNDRGVGMFIENYVNFSYAVAETHLKNNIWWRCNSQMVWWQDDGTTDIEGEGNLIQNNIFYDHSSYNLFEWDWNGGGTGLLSLSSAESSYPDLIMDNIESYPLFVDTTTYPYDLTLQESSPAVDAACPLTLVNDAGGGSGTSLVVDEGWYFCDGWGMVEGDSIKIDDANPVGITGISGNTITLEASRTWDDNDGVYLHKNGVTYNDIGAKQYTGEEEPPSTPQKWLRGYKP